MGLTFELDWLTLEPKDQPGLAWRPVLLAHGWRGGPDDLAGLDPLQGRAAWGIGLASRDVGFAAAALDPFGTIGDNAAAFSAAVADLKQRFGVERVNVVGYCKGGIDAREHVRRLEDFAESPRFTVGGTVTGLVGRGLVLELAAEGPPGTPAATPLRVLGNGPFTFTFPGLVSGNPYEVRVKTPPANPVQVCTVNNASGTIEDANVTNVEVLCV